MRLKKMTLKELSELNIKLHKKHNYHSEKIEILDEKLSMINRERVRRMMTKEGWIVET